MAKADLMVERPRLLFLCASPDSARERFDRLARELASNGTFDVEAIDAGPAVARRSASAHGRSLRICVLALVGLAARSDVAALVTSADTPAWVVTVIGWAATLTGVPFLVWSDESRPAAGSGASSPASRALAARRLEAALFALCAEAELPRSSPPG